jgi:glycosyltransferase involved in cell wall biosynthesis
MSELAGGRPLHILLLADRDWTHPQTGGNGANIWGHVSRWVEWGHRVTVVAGMYPGAKPVESYGPNLVVHRAGGRSTVFPHAFWKVIRGVGRDADVVLEVINGITFLTPLWLRKPRLAMVHHVHHDLYEGEFGPRLGRVLFWLLEAMPLRLLYRRVPFSTISQSARSDLMEVGIPGDHIAVEYLGVDPRHFRRGRRAERPVLLFVGRLKAYKRIELVLDVLEAVPGATLDIAGDGDHRPRLEDEIARRGLSDRVRMHGYVDDETRAELYGRAWVALTASSSEGWSLTVMEAALCGTPSAALAVGGLPESIVHGETGLLAHDPAELIEQVRTLVADPELRDRMGDAAERRARYFSWDRVAAANLELLRRQAFGEPTAGVPGLPSQPANGSSHAAAAADPAPRP